MKNTLILSNKFYFLFEFTTIIKFTNTPYQFTINLIINTLYVIINYHQVNTNTYIN